jgi:hypothetical protein
VGFVFLDVNLVESKDVFETSSRRRRSARPIRRRGLIVDELEQRPLHAPIGGELKRTHAGRTKAAVRRTMSGSRVRFSSTYRT